jgi:hypothetical protein
MTKRHFLATATVVRGRTRCGIAIRQRSDGTWERQGWGGGNAVLVSDKPDEVECTHCRNWSEKASA